MKIPTSAHRGTVFVTSTAFMRSTSAPS
jgi:hypothetical protein